MKRHYDLTESQIQRQITDWLKLKRFLYMRNNSGAVKIGNRFLRFGKKGSPDLLVFRKGRCFGIEVKDAGNEQSREQIEFQTEFEREGHTYILARKLEDVMEVIR